MNTANQFDIKENLLLFSLALLPSLLLLLFIPPLFNYIDSFLYVNTNIAQLVPHYPPLYPLFCNAIWQTLGTAESTLFFFIGCQHLLYCASILYAAFAFASFSGRVVFLLAMSTFLAGPVTCHSVLSESLVLPGIVFAIGAILRICRESKSLLNWIVLFVALIMAAATRFSAISFVTVLPLFALLNSWLKDQKTSIGNNKLVAISTGLGIAVFFAATSLQTVTCRAVGQRNRNLIGRPGYTLFEDISWSAMSKREKDVYIKKLQLRTKSPIIRKAIFLCVEHEGGGWLPIQRRIKKMINKYNSHAPAASKFHMDADYCMNEIFYILVTTIDNYTLQALKERFQKYLKRADFVSTHLEYAAVSVHFYKKSGLSDPRYAAFYDKLSSINVAKAKVFLEFKKSHVVKLNELVPPWGWALLVLVLCLAGQLFNRPLNRALLLAMLIVAVTRLFAVSLVTLHLLRYGTPSLLLIHLALACCLASMMEPRVQTL